MSSALRHPLPGDASRATPEVRLSVEQVSYAYAPNPSQAPLFTLEAMSFQARPGELVAILGPNASGKSTLLKLISGSLAPLSGRIFLNGFETHSLPVKTRAQRIALVQQESRLLFPSRAWEFVMQGRHPYGGGLRFESEEDILIANNALAQVGAAELADRWMDKISGGRKAARDSRPRTRAAAAPTASRRADSAPRYRRPGGSSRISAPPSRAEPLHRCRRHARA